jgi:hypothetical protein
VKSDCLFWIPEGRALKRKLEVMRLGQVVQNRLLKNKKTNICETKGFFFSKALMFILGE